MDMAKQNVRSGNLPSTNMHLLLFNFFGEGRDMYMPYFRVKGDEPTIDGTALFRGDRLAGHIGYKESIMLKLLVENGRNSSILIPVKEATGGRESYVAMQTLRSKAEYEVKRLRPAPSVAIRVQLDGVLRKVPGGIDLSSPEEIERIERDSESYIEREIEALLAYCKERRTDPVGLGDLVRSRDRRWSEREFQERYPTLATQVNVSLNIFQTGVGE
jgi:Ger(x)C family germination protein